MRSTRPWLAPGGGVVGTSRRRIRYCSMLMVVATAISAQAAANEPMTLDQLIATAEHDNQKLRAVRLAIDSARARLVQASALPNPKINVGAGSDFAFRNEGSYTASVGISQDFPIAGRLLHQKAVALVDIELAQTEFLDAQRRLAGEIAANSYRILVLDRQILARDALSAAEERLASITRSRFKAAEVSELDVNAVSLELQRTRQERLLLQLQRRTLLQSLNQQLGRPANSPLEIAEPLPRVDAIPTLESVLSKALLQRPDQRQASLQIDRAQAELGLANAKRWEDWSVGLGVQQGRQDIVGAPPQPNERALTLSVTVPLSLRSRTEGRLAEAAIGVRQSRALSEALTQQIRNEVEAAHAETASLQALSKDFDSTLLPVSARNVELARKGYEQGLVPLLEVIQAQRQEFDLKAAALNTLDLYLQAYARLRTAVADYPLLTDLPP